MKTLADAYAEQHGCAAADFRWTAFWATLHRHAFLVVPFLCWTDFFDVDLELVSTCGRARNMREVQEALVDYSHHPRNSSWFRRALRMRVSSRRMKLLARQYMASGASTRSPFASPRGAEDRALRANV